MSHVVMPGWSINEECFKALPRQASQLCEMIDDEAYIPEVAKQQHIEVTCMIHLVAVNSPYLPDTEDIL